MHVINPTPVDPLSFLSEHDHHWQLNAFFTAILSTSHILSHYHQLGYLNIKP